MAGRPGITFRQNAVFNDVHLNILITIVCHMECKNEIEIFGEDYNDKINEILLAGSSDLYQEQGLYLDESALALIDEMEEAPFVVIFIALLTGYLICHSWTGKPIDCSFKAALDASLDKILDIPKDPNTFSRYPYELVRLISPIVNRSKFFYTSNNPARFMSIKKIIDALHAKIVK